jgi:hypothetical protein
MNKVSFPLNLGVTGATVVDLQDGLQLVLERGAILPNDAGARRELSAALKRERDEQRYGDITGRVVGVFQGERRLRPSNEVDEATAKALNAVLKELGAFDERDSENIRTVDEKNALVIIDLLRRLGRGGGVVPAQHRSIAGVVVLEHGGPAVKLRLRLYLCAFGQDSEKIAEDETTGDGSYLLKYPAGQVRAWVEIRAVGHDGKEVPLTRALFDLDAEVKINLVAPAALQPLEPEYARLTGDLRRHGADLNALAKAKESEERRDVSSLNRLTGWDARLIAVASQAAALTTDGAVAMTPETVYALLRTGLPSDKLQLAHVSGEVVEQALKKAASAGLIAMAEAEISGARQQFENFARETRLAMTAPGSRSTYTALLKASGLRDEAQKKFAHVYVSHQGTAKELWEKAKAAGIAEEDIIRLRQQGKLAFLTMNSGALSARLSALGVADPVELVERDFHKAERWAEELSDLAGNDENELESIIPAAYVGEKVADRFAAYTADLARKVRIAYPTQVVARVLEDEADTFKLGRARGATTLLLKEASKSGFKLGTTPVQKFVTANPAAIQRVPRAEQQAAIRGAMKLQRAYQITPSNAAMTTLMSLGLTSAYDVVATSEEHFVERYGKHFRSGEARLVHRKSRQVSSVTYNLFTMAKQLEASSPVYAFSPSPAAADAAKQELIKQFPTMESLFGSMDFCECDHCRSVLSPAAYLVNLLQFLDPDALEWGNILEHWNATHGSPYAAKYKKPYDALIERRPDLPYIALTCANTKTSLPYIDLVNEILEYYVANGALDEEAARDTGSATTAELLAEPQNIIAAAYEPLRQAKYPLTLPFDLWLETVRKFTDAFETPFWQVLESFRKSDELFVPLQPFDRAAVFFESLGLTAGELDIFADPNPLSRWFELYGYPNAAAATAVAIDPMTEQRLDLNAAKALARRLGVTYNELTDVIRTEFVNPKLASLITLDKLELSVADVYIYKGAKAFYDANNALIRADPAGLSAAERARYDGLSEGDWTKLGEVDAIEKKLAAFTTTYSASAFDAKAWLNTASANNAFDDILVLADPNAGCDFDKTTLQYAGGQPADSIAFLKVNLFVRLWRKLGWTIEETDRALRAFIPADAPFDATHVALAPLKTALIYLAHLKALDARVRAGKHSRLKLLTLWTGIPTTGRNPLYAQLFLTRGVLKNDSVFDDPLGRYLINPTVMLKDHILALQGAIGVSADDVRCALEDAELNPDTVALSLDAVSTVYRYSLLAKGLGLTTRELVAIRRMSKLNPFTPIPTAPAALITDDVPFSQTLAFVEVVAWIKDLGLRVSDLEYLLRHQFDPAGAYRPDAEATLALVKSLSDRIRAIQAAHAVPADLGALSDDVLRQKLSLALPSAVVDRFLAFLNGTVETTVTRSSVAAGDALKAAGFANEPSIVQVSYDPVRQEQKLTFRGVLVDAQKKALTATLPVAVPPAVFVPSALFSHLLEDVQAQQRAFFVKNLEKQTPGVEPVSGFLDLADFDLLFAPPAGSLSDAQLQTRLRLQRERLATAFLPYLQQRLTRELIVNAIAAQLAADRALVERLLSDADIVGDPDPLTQAFAATATRGLSARFYSTNDATGVAIASSILIDADTALKNAAGDPIMPAATRSAVLDGYAEVAVPGAYRFFVTLEKASAKVDFVFDHLTAPLVTGTAAADGEEISGFTDLKPGVLYGFRVNLGDLNGGGARVSVQGESLPKDGLQQLTLYPRHVVASAGAALVRARKVLQLVQSLGLTERELVYFTKHAASFDNLDLSALPARAEDDTLAGAQALFKSFARLAAYAQLKREVAGGSDELIGVFEESDPARAYGRIAALTRREPTLVKETAEALWTAEALGTAPVFPTERPIRRLWDALQVVERFGVSPSSIAGWTKILSRAATGSERFAIARGVKEAIKARFEPAAWQALARPVFDALRQRQRDALVAYIIQQKGFSSREQLYEYFLIDPGMEPVVQTSRIRLALASVQLFVQRVLLNLESKVPPGVLNAKQWEWMSRYRVWEANRKIFLFPENWLEPEFRDDKTFLFKELEGALLEGDVSSDLVEDAFLTYLQKLDEIARLDLIAMHVEDNRDSSLRTLHVLGRTHGSPHRYFYRKYQHQTWTPWEPVTLKIDGDHLAPVIWRDRLYLFWVTFEFRPHVPDGATEIDARERISVPPALREVDVRLHWATNVKGEWTTPESSDALAVVHSTTSRLSSTMVSLTRTPLTVDSTFDPASVFIHVSKEAYDGGEERGVLIHLGGDIKKAFYVAGRNSTPVLTEADAAPPNPYNAKSKSGTRYLGFNALTVTFAQSITTSAGKPSLGIIWTPTILGGGSAYSLLPCDNEITLGAPDPSSVDARNPGAVAKALARGMGEIATLIKPFFYQDNSTTLFVEPEVEEKTVEQWEDWVTPSPPLDSLSTLPQWWDDLVVVPGVPYHKPPFPTPDDYQPHLGGIDMLRASPESDWLTNPSTGLLFHGELIDTAGRAGSVLPSSLGAAAPPRITNVIGGAGLKTMRAENIGLNRSFR